MEVKYKTLELSTQPLKKITRSRNQLSTHLEGEDCRAMYHNTKFKKLKKEKE